MRRGFSSFSSPVTLFDPLPMGHTVEMKEYWSLETPPEEMEFTEVGGRVRIRARAQLPGWGALHTEGNRVRV